jgi:hypothetical protein
MKRHTLLAAMMMEAVLLAVVPVYAQTPDANQAATETAAIRPQANDDTRTLEWRTEEQGANDVDCFYVANQADEACQRDTKQ